MNFKLFDSRPTPRQVDLALLVIRVMAGIIFMVHGWQKVGMGLEGVAGFFGQIGAPLPALTGPLVTYLELVGGAALILGLLTRPLAAMLAVDMFMATMLVHRENGFSGQGGMEFTLMLCAAAIALVIAGAGALSVDVALDKPKS